MGWFWFASSVGAAFETRESPRVQFRVLDSGSWRLVLHQAGPEARYCVRGAESRPIHVSTASGRRPLPSAHCKAIASTMRVPVPSRTEVSGEDELKRFRADSTRECVALSPMTSGRDYRPVPFLCS
jgi:hypothetical protein